MHDEQDDEDEKDFNRVPPEGQKPKKKSRRNTKDLFVQVPMWWAKTVFKATKNPKFLICIEILLRAWEAKGSAFVLPNGRLEKDGASRKAKYRVLRDLESAGLITIERRPHKNPRITMVVL